LSCLVVLSMACCAPAVVSGASMGAGAYFSAVITPDGQVWTWGHGGSGQLGHGTSASLATPTAVSGLTDAVAVATGAYHTLVLRSDGTVWSVGRNAEGQLGDGTTTGRSTAVQVVGLVGVVAIAAGDYHSVALTSSGAVCAWGKNTNGQLGNGGTANASLAVCVALGSTAIGIAAGADHTLAILSDRTVRAWGKNSTGQLGIGNTNQQTLPVPMTGVTDAAAVAAGAGHTLVLRQDGTVCATGANSRGQLGDGTFTQRTTAVPAPGLADVALIEAGAEHSASVHADGTLRTWGANQSGQLGDGTTTQRPMPTAVAGNIVAVTAGSAHSLAVATGGIVQAWGQNGNSQLGDGTTTPSLVPLPISDANYAWKTPTPVLSISSGTYTTPRNVVVSVAGGSAELHYSLTGEDPGLNDPTVAPGGSVLIDETRTLTVRAWMEGRPASHVARATYTMQVATPAFSPAPGTSSAPRTVTLSTITPGSGLHYTTDGTTPSESSPPYTAPLLIATTTVLKVVGVRPNWTPSSVASGTFTMNFGTLSAPVVTPAPATYPSSVDVTLTAPPGSTIRYTLDGTTPTPASLLYGGPFAVSSSKTVKAIALHPDYTPSAVMVAHYTIQVEAPALTPGPGFLDPDQLIAVHSATPGAALHYTLTGIEPTESDPIIPSGGTLVAGNYTLKVKAWKTGCDPSATTTGLYATSRAARPGMLAAGDAHGLAARPDGVVWAWGANSAGQLGDGTTTARSIPVMVTGLTGVRAVAAGSHHSLALMTDGTLRAWGSGAQGQLGDGQTDTRTMPVAVASLSNVVAVAASGQHSVALTADGLVWTWGSNNNGQLGDGTTTPRLVPVQVTGLTNAIGISAGTSHTLALDTTGRVWAWGNNASGQLGDGTTTSHLVPVVVGGIAQVAQIAAGADSSYAVLADGAMRAWGDNASGQLGDGTLLRRLSPVPVLDVTLLSQAAAGSGHALALDGAGGIWAWGGNAHGQLGDGTTTARSLALPVAGLPHVVQAVAGAQHSLALTSDGTIWSWGRNTSGQLGDGTTVTRLMPVQVAGPGFAWTLPTPVLGVAAGRYFSALAVPVTCSEPEAVLRYSTNGMDPTENDPVIGHGASIPVDVSLTVKVNAWRPGFPTSAVAAASYELKALPPAATPEGGAFPAVQQVTLDTTTPNASLTYTLDTTPPTPTTLPYAGAITVDRSATLKAVAWKDGWTSSDPLVTSYWIREGVVDTPVVVPAAGTFVLPFVASADVATEGATLRYTLDGTTPTHASPVLSEPVLVTDTCAFTVRAFKNGWTPSAMVSTTYTRESPGAAAAPFLTPSGGRYTTQQLVTVTGPEGATLRYTTTGSDPTEADPEIASGATLQVDRSVVVKVRAFAPGQAPSAVRTAAYLITGAVAAGQMHTHALVADGTVYGWGLNYNGQVGDGTATTRLSPVMVASDVVALAAGDNHTLALKRDGTVVAWGRNTYGQIGDGTTYERRSPVPVSGLTEVVAVAAGGEHSLALRADGTVWGWGRNSEGELGDGTHVNRSSPSQVAGLSGVVALAAGGDVSVALISDQAEAGTVWTWGDNTHGQLGDGTTVGQSRPIKVAGVPSATAVAAGRDWVLVRLANGVLWTWGANDVGQLGDGSTTMRPWPDAGPRVAPLEGVSSGTRHGLALTPEGVAWAWGSDSAGQLGRGDLACPLSVCASPAAVLGAEPALAVAAGGQHSVILRADGRVLTTGYNTNGQLGDGTTTSRAVPLVLPGLTLVANDWMLTDADRDGLPAWREFVLGTDPFNPDTNGNGLLDGDEVLVASPTHPDWDRDGVPTVLELLRGTDPFDEDTDHDGVGDGTDAFPLDPSRTTGPVPTPGDTTPPLIVVTEPATARPVPPE